MKMKPYIYSGAVEGVLALLENNDWNIPKENLLKAAGVSSKDLYLDSNRVSLRTFGLILEKAFEITGDDALVFKIMKRIEQFAGGPVHYAFRQSPSVKVALEIGVRYAGLIISFKKLDFKEENDGAYFRWENYETYDDLPRIQVWTPARVVTMLRAALGGDWTPQEVSLINKRPENEKPYMEMFGPQVKFEQPENFIKLTYEELEKEMPARDEKLWQGLVSLSEKLMAEVQPEQAVVTAVRRQILKALPDDQANVKHISGQMAKSPRTLQRELQAAGTSFSSLLEEVRRGMAHKYLVDSNLHISQIAFLLGFSEVSVFTRAVNRWFGQTPSAYRKLYDHIKNAG